MKGQPQLPRSIITLGADVTQAVLVLRDALRTQRGLEKKYAAEQRSEWRRETAVNQLHRALGKAIALTGEARGNLDAVLLGADDE